MSSHFRIVLEAEDNGPRYKRAWTKRDWEDVIAAGGESVHVQSVELVETTAERICAKCGKPESVGFQDHAFALRSADPDSGEQEDK